MAEQRLEEKWFVALPHGGKRVDIRAKYVEDVGMGSRFVCEVTQEDAATIVAALGAQEREASLDRALRKAIRSHENLLELRIIPDRYRDECRQIIDVLQAALAPQDGGRSER